MRTHTDLWLCCLTPEQHSHTCGYWYAVTVGHTAQKAFARSEALLHWLEERGLSLSDVLPEPGKHQAQRIIGSYGEEMHGSYDDVMGREGVETRTLSNGDYTLCIIDDQSGIKCEHYLNPNCRRRPVFDYHTTRAVYN